MLTAPRTWTLHRTPAAAAGQNRRCRRRARWRARRERVARRVARKAVRHAGAGCRSFPRRASATLGGGLRSRRPEPAGVNVALNPDHREDDDRRGLAAPVSVAGRVGNWLRLRKSNNCTHDPDPGGPPRSISWICGPTALDLERI